MKTFLLVLLLLSVSLVSAQDQTCPVLDEESITTLKDQCRVLEIGQACVLDADPDPLTDSAVNAPALVKVTNGLTLALIGDATLQPVVSKIQPLPVTNPNGYAVNLREGPGTGFALIGTLGVSESAEADGASADQQWLRLTQGAWVSASLVTLDGDIESLPVLDESSTVQSAAAFILSASGDCENSGVLFSTRGAGELTLNDSLLTWTSGTTAFVRVGAEGALEVRVLDGEITTTTDDTPDILTAAPENTALDLPLALVTVDAGAPEETVYAYLQARTESDTIAMQDLSCAAWDSQALIQSQSFRAMSAQLKDVNCVTASSTDDSAVVTCEGVILTTYNGQNREWPIGGFALVLEDESWRICGEAD